MRIRVDVTINAADKVPCSYRNGRFDGLSALVGPTAFRMCKHLICQEWDAIRLVKARTQSDRVEIHHYLGALVVTGILETR